MISIPKQVQLIKLKTAIKPCQGCLFTWINDTLFYFQAEKSSMSHTMSILFENELKNANEDLFISDDDEAGNILKTWNSRKRSMLPKGNPATYF